MDETEVGDGVIVKEKEKNSASHLLLSASRPQSMCGHYVGSHPQEVQAVMRATNQIFLFLNNRSGSKAALSPFSFAFWFIQREQLQL